MITKPPMTLAASGPRSCSHDDPFVWLSSCPGRTLSAAAPLLQAQMIIPDLQERRCELSTRQ